MSNLPYRQPRKPTRYQYNFSQDWGKIWGGVFLLVAGGAFLIWPALVFNGSHPQKGALLDWTTTSLTASCLWWGFLAFTGICVAVSRELGPHDRSDLEG